MWPSFHTTSSKFSRSRAGSPHVLPGRSSQPGSCNRPLKVTIEYKVANLSSQKNVDWESCQTKYSDSVTSFFRKIPFSPSTRKHENGLFKKNSIWRAFSVTVFTGNVWKKGKSAKKKVAYSNENGSLWTVPDSFFFFNFKLK